MTMHNVPQGVTSPPRRQETAAPDQAKRAPGTFVLAFVFLAAFVVYYFVNWKLLSFVWRIG